MSQTIKQALPKILLERLKKLKDLLEKENNFLDSHEIKPVLELQPKKNDLINEIARIDQQLKEARIIPKDYQEAANYLKDMQQLINDNFHKINLEIAVGRRIFQVLTDGFLKDQTLTKEYSPSKRNKKSMPSIAFNKNI